MKIEKPRGMAGTILVILIFGLLVSISTAYIKMVQTETQVQGMIDNSDRALDAAFSGVNMVIAILQSQKGKVPFENDPSIAKSRIYFIRPSHLSTDWSLINISNLDTASTFVNATSSDWFYLNENLDLFDYGETGSSTKPYQFRVHSYPGTDAGGTIVPASYTIKSQGRFLVYDSNRTTVLATYTAQVIADCAIDFTRKVIQLKRWRYMPYEDNASFAKAVYY